MNVRATLVLPRALISIFLLSTLTLAGTIAPACANTTRQIAIVAFGDSLTAGYGLSSSESFPAQLQMALQAKGHKVVIINAGVSGDTTAAGLQRLDWALEPKPDGVILELGANDALRGFDPKQTRINLDNMLSELKSKGVDVLVAGMKSPSNWGPDYAREFDAIYPDLAAKFGVALYPFFLDGVALDRALVQPDGLHPTVAGVAQIVKRILPDVEALLGRIEQRKSAGE